MSHFTRKMADRRLKWPPIHHRLFRLNDVNVTKPRPTLSDRSDALSYIAAGASEFGVSTVPFGAYQGRTGRTGRTGRAMQRYIVAGLLGAYRLLRVRYSGGQPLIGSGTGGSPLATGSNSQVHNRQYNC